MLLAVRIIENKLEVPKCVPLIFCQVFIALVLDHLGAVIAVKNPHLALELLQFLTIEKLMHDRCYVLLHQRGVEDNHRSGMQEQLLQEIRVSRPKEVLVPL